MDVEAATLTKNPAAEGEAAGRERPAQGTPVDWNAPLTGAMFAFLVPLLLSNAVQGLSSTVSSILVGRYIGVAGLAAISAFFPVMFFLISFLIGLTSGGTVLVGQAFGAGRMDRVRAVAGTTLSFTFLSGVAVSVIGALFAPKILVFMGTPANILAQAESFARIAFLAPAFLFLFFAYSAFLRGIGDSNTPFYFLVVNTVLGAAVTPALIFGWAGLPRAGLNGAAWAMSVAPLLTLALLLAHLHRVRHPLRFDRDMVRHLRIDGRILAAMLKIGIPTAIQMVAVSLSEIAVVSLVNRFGSNATAAYGAYYQVANYVQMPAISLGMTASIFGAQAIGAGRQDRLAEVVRSAMRLNLAIGGALVTLSYLFAGEILSLFLAPGAAFRIAHGLLMITLWSYLVFGAASIFGGIMRASGVVLWPTALTIVSIWLVEIPTAYLLSRQIGIDGVWIGYSAAFVSSLVLQYGYYRLFWVGRQHRRMIEA